MKTITKTITYLQITALFLTAALAGAAAAEKEKPFHGTIQTVDTDVAFEFPFVDVSAIGTGNATHLGRYTVTYEAQINVTESSSTGTFVFTAANGDTLFTTFEGRGLPTDDPIDVLLVLEVHTITGGTGRFAGATGSFVREALYDNEVPARSSGSLDGTIVIHKKKHKTK